MAQTRKVKNIVLSYPTIYNINIESMRELDTPENIMSHLQSNEEIRNFVNNTRKSVHNILI